MSVRPSDPFRARLELAEEGYKNACAAAEAAHEAALARADADLGVARRAILLEALAALDLASQPKPTAEARKPRAEGTRSTEVLDALTVAPATSAGATTDTGTHTDTGTSTDQGGLF